ncbi:hypothetical protein ATANTOWER_019727 [Ataeniobius toweri]|uniref:Uncharacterized protein n=1 Tax=Ataeniobius toweri TaxID=208326 RepID=A0ABU7AQI9_9TELE|nr:hypothetical protein [Ataeniobius toweri]
MPSLSGFLFCQWIQLTIRRHCIPTSQHGTTELGGDKQTHLSLPPLPAGHSRVEESPTSLKELGFIAHNLGSFPHSKEKRFFHKVSERISKPNIFILHNRWDASVTEPGYIEQVRKQHMDRCVSFLSDELRVVGPDEAAGRIFFISAKEVLSSRTQRAQGMPETGGALAEGFHDRLREFQQFERTFEEFISRSAVRTKFEQHTVRACQITEAIKAVMDAINITSADRKICCLEDREEQRDRLDFVRGQMNRLSDSVKDRIRTLTDDVAAKVASALLDQIHSLPVLVEEFRADFNPTQETLQLYKAVSAELQHPGTSNPDEPEEAAVPDLFMFSKLVQHVEERLVGCLTQHCSISVLRDIQETQRLMIDFRENIDFQFSLGWTALVTRFIGATNAKRALSGGERGLKEGPFFKNEAMVTIATGLVSVTSRASMAVLVIGGVVSPQTSKSKQEHCLDGSC